MEKRKDYYRSQFRLPQELYDHLKAAADETGRSVNAELVSRLESTFQFETTYKFPIHDLAKFMDGLNEQFDTVQRAFIQRVQALDVLTAETQALKNELTRLTGMAHALQKKKD